MRKSFFILICAAFMLAVWLNTPSEQMQETNPSAIAPNRVEDSGFEREVELQSVADDKNAVKDVATQTRDFAPKEGAYAPEFQLLTFEGLPFEYGSEIKKPTVIWFWASWCGVCKALAPNLQPVSEKYADRVQVIGINVSDDLESAQAFANQFGFSFPLLFDEDRVDSVANLYEVMAVPTLFFVDASGEIVKKEVGLTDAASVEQRFELLTSGK